MTNRKISLNVKAASINKLTLINRQSTDKISTCTVLNWIMIRQLCHCILHFDAQESFPGEIFLGHFQCTFIFGEKDNKQLLDLIMFCGYARYNTHGTTYSISLIMILFRDHDNLLCKFCLLNGQSQGLGCKPWLYTVGRIHDCHK
jgi:hypothetical protein